MGMGGTFGGKNGTLGCGLAVALLGAAMPVAAQSIRGTASYTEPVSLPADAVFEALLEDVSRADAPAELVARTRMAAPPGLPLEFEIAYDTARIEPRRRYAVRARVVRGETLLYTSDTAHHVLTQGASGAVAVTLRRVEAGAAATAPPGLCGTSWRLVRLVESDETERRPDDPAKYTLAFEADGGLAVRIDCSRGRGSWTSPVPSGLELGPLALTRAACPKGSLHDLVVKHWPAVRAYAIREGRLFLLLTDEGGILELEPAPAPPK
jgi:uncharacterized lipoprotein YbaY